MVDAAQRSSATSTTITGSSSKHREATTCTGRVTRGTVVQASPQASGAVHQLESSPAEGPQGKVWRFTRILLTTGLEEVIGRAATNERVVACYGPHSMTPERHHTVGLDHARDKRYATTTTGQLLCLGRALQPQHALRRDWYLECWSHWMAGSWSCRAAAYRVRQVFVLNAVVVEEPR